MGLQADGRLVQVFASLQSGSWTIVTTAPSGLACIVAAGRSWESLPAKTGDRTAWRPSSLPAKRLRVWYVASPSRRSDVAMPSSLRQPSPAPTPVVLQPVGPDDVTELLTLAREFHLEDGHPLDAGGERAIRQT